MKKIARAVLQNPLLKANMVMVGGAFVGHFGAYLYHLIVGRMLPPSEYGILQSLISLSNLITVPLVMLNTMMVKFVSQFAGRGELGKVAYLYNRLSRGFWWTLAVGGVSFFLFYQPVLQFLHISSVGSFVFLDIALFFGLLQMLNRSVIQGLSRFVELVVSNIMESYGKLLFGVLAVTVGWGATGAFGAFVLAGALTYLYTTVVLRSTAKHTEVHAAIGWRRLGKESVASLIMTISMIALFNIDVVLVRHFFSGVESGLYAALSVLGKIIYFGSSPVANTMLPMVSEAHVKGTGFHRMFLTSLFLTILFAGGVTALYALFPRQSLTILIGSQYAAAAPYLPYFSLFLSLCALINIVTMFYFSTHQFVPIFFMPVAAVAQAVLIWLYHETLLTVVTVSLGVTASLLGMLLLYYAYALYSETSLRHRARIPAGKVH